MLRVLAASLCFTAVAEFTTDKLDDMASSIQTTADQMQHKVMALAKEIAPISAGMGTWKVQMLTADDETKAALKKYYKIQVEQMCKGVDSLSQISAEASKTEGEAKESLAKIQAQSAEKAADPEKLNDGPNYEQYVAKIQIAIGTVAQAASIAETYTSTIGGGVCKADDPVETAITRLFLQENPEVSGFNFDVPSALLGALGATVIGSAAVLLRTKSSSRSPVALMEEGNLECEIAEPIGIAASSHDAEASHESYKLSR